MKHISLNFYMSNFSQGIIFLTFSFTLFAGSVNTIATKYQVRMLILHIIWSVVIAFDAMKRRI